MRQHPPQDLLCDNIYISYIQLAICCAINQSTYPIYHIEHIFQTYPILYVLLNIPFNLVCPIEHIFQTYPI